MVTIQEKQIARRYGPIVAAGYRAGMSVEIEKPSRNNMLYYMCGRWERMCYKMLGKKRYMESRRDLISVAKEIGEELGLEGMIYLED